MSDIHAAIDSAKEWAKLVKTTMVKIIQAAQAALGGSSTLAVQMRCKTPPPSVASEVLEDGVARRDEHHGKILAEAQIAVAGLHSAYSARSVSSLLMLRPLWRPRYWRPWHWTLTKGAGGPAGTRSSRGRSGRRQTAQRARRRYPKRWLLWGCQVHRARPG